jgi:hypothetical protein
MPRFIVSSMTITLDEVIAFADKWFLTVWGGGSAAAQAAFFLHPQSRIYVVQGGETISFEEHEKLHKQWTDEHHLFGGFNLSVINTAPERVRATGTVYWDAQYRDRPPPNVIRAIVGEDWIIERILSGELRFVLYMNLFHHLLPGSAPLKLE